MSRSRTGGDLSVAESGTLERLTSDERSRLAKCEATIERGITAFVEIGRALRRIRDERLYRERYPTFEAYVRDRWDLGRRRAYQIVAAAEVHENLGLDSGPTDDPFGDDVPFPDAEVEAKPPSLPAPKESHARTLAKLPADEQREAWVEAVETAPAGKVTARHVETVVSRRLADAAPEPEAAVPADVDPGAAAEPDEAEPADDEYDPVAELEAAHSEILALQAKIESLTATDKDAEIRRLHEVEIPALRATITGLDARLTALDRARAELERTGRYQARLLRQIREALGVERDRDILPALRSRRAA